MSAIGLIPARLQSTRLPRKLLLDQTGKTMLQHTWEAACQSESLSEVIVATDSEEIAETVRQFGGRYEMTEEHPSGTDRIAEIVRKLSLDAEIIVNIQGDEPEIDPAFLDQLVEILKNHPNAQMSTLGTPITKAEERDDPSCTKVVCAKDGRALYFSRATIPFCRDADLDELLKEDSPWKLHLGLYGYRRDFLLELSTLPPSPLENLEKLEQLRVLEAGATIQVGIVNHRSVGIDTEEDYAQFVTRFNNRTA